MNVTALPSLPMARQISWNKGNYNGGGNVTVSTEMCRWSIGETSALGSGIVRIVIFCLISTSTDSEYINVAIVS